MKRHLIMGFSLASVLSAVVLMAACKTMTAAEKAELARKVTQCLDDKHYTIDIQMMSPRFGPTKNVSSDWALTVRNDSLFSYLPYVGRAFGIPFGGGKGLNFDAPIGRYSESTAKNGMRHIEIDVKNEEDTYWYTIDVFDNGNTTIDIRAQERDNISFSGNLVLDD